MKRLLFPLYIGGTIIFLIAALLVFNIVKVNQSPMTFNYPEFEKSESYGLQDIQEYLDKFEQDSGNTQVIYLENLNSPKYFHSLGVGDLSGKRDNIWLEFDRQIIGNQSLENFKKYSQPRRTVLNINLKDGGRISIGDEAVRDNTKIVFTSYENGILTGVLVTKVSTSFTWISDNSPDTKCITGDIVGMCGAEKPINLDLIVNFKVRAE